MNPVIWTEKKDRGRADTRGEAAQQSRAWITPRSREQQELTKAELLKELQWNSLQVILLKTY